MHGSMFCIAGVTAKRSSLEADDVSLRVGLYTAEGLLVLAEFMAQTVNTEEVKAFGTGAPPWFYYKATTYKIYYRCKSISDDLWLKIRPVPEDLQLIHLRPTRYQQVNLDTNQATRNINNWNKAKDKLSVLRLCYHTQVALLPKQWNHLPIYTVTTDLSKPQTDSTTVKSISGWKLKFSEDPMWAGIIVSCQAILIFASPG
jgi:hypothetical protein